MIGVVLCAGRGSRLGHLTQDVPKTMLPVGDGRTILDTIFDGIGSHVDRVRIVAGYHSEVLIAAMEGRADVEVMVVEDVDRWNNARSLWSALLDLEDDVLVANGDTVVHPDVTASFVEQSGTADIALCVDANHDLGEEEMKIAVDDSQRVHSISKQLDPATSDGEYIGQSLISAGAVSAVAGRLEDAWRIDPQNYYEDGYQLAINAGMVVRSIPMKNVGWSEVDDLADLTAARGLTWL